MIALNEEELNLLGLIKSSDENTIELARQLNVNYPKIMEYAYEKILCEDFEGFYVFLCLKNPQNGYSGKAYAYIPDDFDFINYFVEQSGLPSFQFRVGIEGDNIVFTVYSPITHTFSYNCEEMEIPGNIITQIKSKQK